MKFRNDDHKKLYLDLMVRMKRNDAYHRSAAYLMALVPMVEDDVFDFGEDCIRHEGLFAGWQTSSSRRVTRLMYNLWNGCCEDVEADRPESTSGYYAVDSIFCDYEYAPWFYEAIRIRFEWV